MKHPCNRCCEVPHEQGRINCPRLSREIPLDCCNRIAGSPSRTARTLMANLRERIQALA